MSTSPLVHFPHNPLSLSKTPLSSREITAISKFVNHQNQDTPYFREEISAPPLQHGSFGSSSKVWNTSHHRRRQYLWVLSRLFSLDVLVPVLYRGFEDDGDFLFIWSLWKELRLKLEVLGIYSLIRIEWECMANFREILGTFGSLRQDTHDQFVGMTFSLPRPNFFQ